MDVNPRTGSAVLVALTLSAGAMATQQQEGPFRTKTELVRLEVSILDAARTPIHGLKLEDFLLQIDGVRQPVSVVEEVRLSDSFGRATEVATEVSTNSIADSRLFVIVMDDAQAPFDPFAARMARDASIELVRHLLRTDLVSVVFTWDIQKGQEFTSHHEKAIQAIERFRPSGADPRFAAIYAERTLTSVLASLYALPGYRRAVFLVSPGIGLERENQFASFGSFGDDTDADRVFQNNNVLQTIGQERRVRIPIYSVDVKGLVAPTDVRRGMVWPSRAGSDSLKTLADNSGGVAITNTNAPLPAVRSILAENASYYIVGYQPPDSGRKHTIKLSVSQKGALTLVRQYSATVDTSITASSVTRAIAGFLPLSAVPAQMLTRTFPAPDSNGDLIVAVRVGMPPGEKTPAAALDVEWRVFDEWKEVHVEKRRIEGPDLVRTAMDSTLFLRTRLRPGRYHVRIGVKGESWRSAASVFGDVSVPEYGRKAFVSDVILFSSTHRLPSPRRVADLMPYVPDMKRVFGAGDLVNASAALSVPSNASPALVAVDVVSEGGASVYSRQADAPKECQSVCGYSVSFPTQTFAAGRYLVKFTVNAGKNVSMTESSFTVRK